MTDIKQRVRRVEQRLGTPVPHGEIDWPALLARIAKEGRRLVKLDRAD